MTKQERVKAVFAFKEPDLVPIDFGATNNSGIALHAYKDLIHYMDLNDQTIRASDMIQQLAEPSEELLLRFETEFRGGLPKYYATIPLPVESANWKAAHIKRMESCNIKMNGMLSIVLIRSMIFTIHVFQDLLKELQ